MKTTFYFTQQIGKNKDIKVLNTKGQQNTSKKWSYKLKKKEVPISSKVFQKVPKKSLRQFSHPYMYTKHNIVLN
jgi:hypothetical protein